VWHAYWHHREGSGIVAPKKMTPPWMGLAPDSDQAVYFWPGEGELKIDGNVPATWVVTPALRSEQLQRLVTERGIEVVWTMTSTPDLLAPTTETRTWIREMKMTVRRLAQADSRLHLFLHQPLSAKETLAFERLAERLGFNLKIAMDWPRDWPQFKR
jgi:hypothetical protein